MTIRQKVKEKLWKFGYRVKDYDDIMKENLVPFDLIVWNGKQKFRVLTGKTKPKEILLFCDVYAQEKNEKIIFLREEDGKIKKSTSPYAFFGKPKKQVEKAIEKLKIKNNEKTNQNNKSNRTNSRRRAS